MRMTDRLKQAEISFNAKIREVAAAAGAVPNPCVSRKCSPIEALELKIPLPWKDKVNHADRKQLTPELFARLQEHGLSAPEIEKLFGFGINGIYNWLKRHNIKPIQIARKIEPKERKPRKDPEIVFSDNGDDLEKQFVDGLNEPEIDPPPGTENPLPQIHPVTAPLLRILCDLALIIRILDKEGGLLGDDRKP